MSPKKLLRKWLPDPDKMKGHESLRFLGKWLHDPNIWHITRNSTAKAFSVGLFAALLPVPAQMLIAAGLALVFRANLPLSVALTFVSNPFTTAFFVYATYQTGTFILQTPPMLINFTLSVDWFWGEFLHIWKPFLLGAITLGLALGTLGNILVRLLWKGWVIWHRRQRKGKTKAINR